MWLSEQAFQQMALGHVAMLAARRDPGRLLAAAAALRKRFKGTDQMTLPVVQVRLGVVLPVTLHLCNITLVDTKHYPWSPRWTPRTSSQELLSKLKGATFGWIWITTTSLWPISRYMYKSLSHNLS